MIKKIEVRVIQNKLKATRRRIVNREFSEAEIILRESLRDFLKISNELKKQVGDRAVIEAYDKMLEARNPISSGYENTSLERLQEAINKLEGIILEIKE